MGAANVTFDPKTAKILDLASGAVLANVEFGNTTAALNEAKLRELGVQPRIVQECIDGVAEAYAVWSAFSLAARPRWRW